MWPFDGEKGKFEVIRKSGEESCKNLERALGKERVLVRELDAAEKDPKYVIDMMKRQLKKKGIDVSDMDDEAIYREWHEVMSMRDKEGGLGYGV